MKEELKCLVPDCSRKIHCRGLCKAHYSFASLLVGENKTTWKKLEQTGKCLQIKTPGPKAIIREWFLEDPATTKLK